MSLASPRALGCSLVLCLLVAAPAARAAEDGPETPLAARTLVSVGMPPPTLVEDRGTMLAPGPLPKVGALFPDVAGKDAARPRALLPLYVSFAALQGLDGATTIRALDRGAVEANPLVGDLASNRAALLALKGGVAVSTIWLSERLWKTNRVAAVALMAALNGLYAAVVAHNYRLGR